MLGYVSQLNCVALFCFKSLRKFPSLFCLMRISNSEYGVQASFL